MNDVSATRLSPLHPELRRRWLLVDRDMEKLGLPVIVVEGFRVWERQAALFAKGRVLPSDVACRHDGVTRPVGTCKDHPLGATVTRARPGASWHQFALALDGTPDDVAKPGLQPDWNETHPAWRTLLTVAKTHSLAEGAEWRTYPDYPHFYPAELPATPSEEVRKLYLTRGLEAVWEWADKLIVPVTAGVEVASGQ